MRLVLLVLKVGAVLMTPSIVTDAHVFLRPCDLAVLNDWLRLYDSDATKAVVKKWVNFYKVTCIMCTYKKCMDGRP